uniref:Proprotein convertase subtilisin/kexin type 5-like isoform X1 n=1 Tax=Petromyzon marinus TaxID=7757 RepID=A0AAJ7WRJ4_PETMA|nr:proprotein convertase subtilisin/kexin type 5-like isoform X1 [Petromyzon marinus]XP_032807344.1 proprotein convertase subtilisin/kexin type 5-like isoform X1 [Petromyzon marinus]
MGAAGLRTWVPSRLPLLLLLLLGAVAAAAVAASSLREHACSARSFALDGSCRPCHSSCAECDGSENFNCTACLVDRAGKERFLHKRHCRLTCPLGFFAERRSHRCQDCADNCQVCSSQDSCTRCQARYHVVNGACEEVQTCEAGQVLDPDTDDCLDCGPGCAGCAPSDPEKCDQCLPGYFLLRARCHHLCPREMYGDLQTGQCTNCGSSCLDCVDAETCRTCPSDHLHLREHCVTRCLPKMFVNGTARRCEPCHESCESCSGPGAEECDSCPQGSFLDAGHCQHLEECASGEFSDTSTGCRRCSPYCAECFGPNPEQCTSCAAGRFLDEQTTCVSSCPEGFVGSEDTRECEECPEGCRQCVADGAAAGGSEGLTCEACWQPEDAALAYYLHLGSCIAECPEHYFESPEEGACVPCDAACATCEGEAAACVTCAGGLLLDGGVCRQGCRERYFAGTDGECRHCPQHCEACTNATACAKCSYLYSLLGGKCYVVCPDGYYEGVDEGRCLGCQESCATCSGPGEDDCERCPPGRPRLYEGRCSEECPRHAFYDAGTGDCQDCDQSCESCTGPTAAECATCASNGGEPDPDTGLCSAEEEEDPAPATSPPPRVPARLLPPGGRWLLRHVRRDVRGVPGPVGP